MYSNDEKILILGSLFHDIGKFVQRGIRQSERLKHQEYSAGFVNDLFKNKLLSDLVYNHHREELDKSILTGKDRALAEIICEADNLASGERQPDPNVKNQQPLETIFSKVDYDTTNQKLYFQDLCELFYNAYKFPIKKDEFNLDKLEEKYSDWWKKFEDEIKKVNLNEIETLYYVLKKYLWCVPSSSYKTRSDVSLFEHSKITAAIAISMFRFLLEKYDGDINKFNNYGNRNEYRYQLVLADITGIQSYIYNIGYKGAAKALKGRSFFLQQMLENIAFHFLSKLSLPITNLIYSSGGKFYLFVPNNKATNDCLEKLQKEIEQLLLTEYNGALGLIIGKIELNGKDLEYKNDPDEGNIHLISKKWDELNSIVEKQKKRKLSNNWAYSLFEPEGPEGEIIKCAFTGVPIIKKEIVITGKTLTQEVKLDEQSPVIFLQHSFDGEVFYQVYDEDKLTDDYISKEQFNSQKIGNDLKKNFNTVIYQDVLEGYSVLGLNSFNISNETKFENKFNAKETRQFLINSLRLNELEGDVNKGFKYYGGDWRFGDTYEEVVKNGQGIPRLGVLRLDVDNLGLIFKDGFGKHATFGRVVQLSSMLDFFFSHYLNKLKLFSWDPKEGLSEEFNKYKFKIREQIEIVYSGGDDVFIVGHWSVLPDIAIWINDRFKKYTSCNDNFSISAGIALFDDKYPIFKAALNAGEYEEIAKKKERKNKDNQTPKVKNGICFLDTNTPVSWNDFKSIRKWVKKFYELIEIGTKDEDEVTKKVSKGFISRLYSIYYEFEKGKFQNWCKWRWRASYSLSRFGRQYKNFQREIEEFAAELFLSSKTEQELIQLLYIIANWTDLLTRKENKNDK